MTGTTFCDAANTEPTSQTREAGRKNDGITLTEILDSNTAVQSKHGIPVFQRAPAPGTTRGGSCWKARDTFVLMTFTGVSVLYMLRVSLSIAIVALVKRNETVNASQISDTCPLPDDRPSETGIVGEFDWSDETIALILGAFFLGFVATSFLGGRAAERFGGRLVFGLGVVVPSVLNLISPLCIYTSEYIFIALRVLEGMAQGVSVPTTFSMMAAWIPPKDKAKHASMILSGVQTGTVIAMFLGGWLCESTFLGGWPSVFYVFGGLGVLWAIPWFFLVHNDPEHHPRISSSELEYILAHRTYVKADKAIVIPWRDIVTSGPLWTIITVNFAYCFSFYTLLTELPTFFSNILHFDMKKNATGSALPYILQGVVCVGWGSIADLLLRRNYMTVKGIRKLSTSLGLYSSAACLIAMMWVKCNDVLAVVVMCLAVGLMGTLSSGSSLSEQDIAPNLAGSLKGFTVTFTASTGFLAPLVTTAITSGNQTVSAWNTVFLISAVLNIFFCTIFMIFGTDQVQPWNNSKTQEVKCDLGALHSHSEA